MNIKTILKIYNNPEFKFNQEDSSLAIILSPKNSENYLTCRKTYVLCADLLTHEYNKILYAYVEIVGGEHYGGVTTYTECLSDIKSIDDIKDLLYEAIFRIKCFDIGHVPKSIKTEVDCKYLTIGINKFDINCSAVDEWAYYHLQLINQNKEK